MKLNKELTLGSLFDGSGGFPLGGLISGITPVWASEIEPFPIRVTTKRMPFVKHYGDVSKMHGGEIEPVDIITFGSPCQDMSVAGKRAGLDGSRSNLFYEAIRIVKEMRCATNGKYPRYIVWENVPGAFSSNKGQDFRSVLEAVCSVKDTDPVIPEPPKGRWDYAALPLGYGQWYLCLSSWACSALRLSMTTAPTSSETSTSVVVPSANVYLIFIKNDSFDFRFRS